MFKPAELPIIGSIINAIDVYLRSSISIAFHPLAFPRGIQFNNNPDLKRSIEYFFASIVINYIVLIPLFIQYDTKTSQNFFILYKFSQYIIIFIVTHFFLLLLGARKSIKTTIILQCYLTGFFVPILDFLNLPFTLKVGPELTLSSDVDVTPELMKTIATALQDKLISTTFAVVVIFSIWGYFVTTIWFATAYEVTKKKALLGMLIGTVIGLIIVGYIWYPIWSHFEDLINLVLSFT